MKPSKDSFNKPTCLNMAQGHFDMGTRHDPKFKYVAGGQKIPCPRQHSLKNEAPYMPYNISNPEAGKALGGQPVWGPRDCQSQSPDTNSRLPQLP